ncbi:MAG: cation:dicarboxylase symporter family transporter [Saprospiraceae bacterium]|nr:cation:dicarboxylase symporter family transporter [Saprospiraceae bacterium]
MKKLYNSLIFWVLTALVFGVFLGHFFPQIALTEVLNSDWKANFLGQDLKIGKTFSELCSGLFISAIKLFILPIIFLTTTLGIVQMGDLKKVGKLGAKSLLYFEIVTTFALLIGIAVALIIRPGDGVIVNTIASGDISKYKNVSTDFSWLDLVKGNTTIQTLLIALVSGIVLSKLNGVKSLIDFMGRSSKYIFEALHKVMLFAPLGAFGGMAYTIAKFGIKSILPLAKLMLTVYVTMALFIFVVLWGLLKYYNINLLHILKYFKNELLIALGTSSSEPVMPALMEKLEKLGCPKSVVGLVVPSGYAFNTDGSTIYMSMAVIFLAQVYQIPLDWATGLSIIGVLMVTTKGTAGVTGLGFMALASTLAAIKIIPIEGLTLLLGIDRFMSEARTITNFTGNAVATIFLANHEGLFDREKMEQALTQNE